MSYVLAMKKFILNQRCIESKPVKLIACQNVKVRENAETIVPSKQNSNTDLLEALFNQNNLMIANALVNTDRDIHIRVANVFHNDMNIKTGDVLTICEPVTKIFHHNEDPSDNRPQKRLLASWYSSRR
ncbi:hypothetical protein Zmor_014320 [Zophobas morio]|uniref:Uncharacterized protein n=1 Tax=Zophobas morio TaxID=2755281 RepID=A0AA38IBY0_9CUCU|nr:hypothetical protein Zmor_014320 [Zophobas morio]